MHSVADSRRDRLVLGELGRHADAHALQVGALRQLHGLRQVDRRRVAGVAAGEDRIEERTVADVPRHRPDLVEARRERNDAEPRDGAVGRTQADVAAERCGLLDRATRVGAERPRREPRRNRGRGAAAGAAGDARRVPRVPGRAVRGVLGRRAHRELVRVRLPEHAQAVRLAALDHGRVVDRQVALEDLRAGGRRDALRPDHVLDRDGHALAAIVVADMEEAMELGIARVDRLAVGGVELGARELLVAQEARRLLRRQTQRVDHEPPGGTLK